MTRAPRAREPHGQEGVSIVMPQLTRAPAVDTGMLIRRPPHDVFEALVNGIRRLAAQCGRDV
jgi:hypothetical protein